MADWSPMTAADAYAYDRSLQAGITPLRLDFTVANHLFTPTGAASSAMHRIPSVTKVSGNATSGRLLYVWEELHFPLNASDGNGCRLAQVRIDYDLVANTIALVPGSYATIEAPAGWASGLGFVGHPQLITLPSGRILLAYCVNESVSQDVTLVNGDDRATYFRYSDDGGVTWSARARIYGETGSLDRFASPGTTGPLVRIPTGSAAGRILIPIYSGSNYKAGYATVFSVLYCDNPDAATPTWTRNAFFSTNVSPYFINSAAEPGVVWTPDGTTDGRIFMHLRDATTYDLPYATSQDNGANFTFQGPHSLFWRAAECASSTTQAALAPSEGRHKILWSGLDNNTTPGVYRRGLVLRVSHDHGVTYQAEYRPFPALTPMGYSALAMIAPDVFVCAYETSTTYVANTDGTVGLYIANMAQVYGGVPAPVLFTFDNTPPSIPTSINPIFSTPAGGITATIHGTGLTYTTGVSFGGIAATGLIILNDTTVTCTVPAHAIGVVDVTVSGVYGGGTLAAAFTYMNYDVAPGRGPIAGGNPIIITGFGFTGVTGVLFDAVAATSVVVVNDGVITCVAPAHSAGLVNVTIGAPLSIVLANAYQYVAGEFLLIDPTARVTRFTSTADGESPYLHDPSSSTVITETQTALAQALEAQHQYPVVDVADATQFPDSPGYVVFAFGSAYQAGPIPYLGVASPTSLLLDPAFTIEQAVPVGATVNLAARMTDEQVPHGDGDFWITPTPAGREACEADIDSIAAGGRVVTKTVLYPDDIGLAGSGLPKHGVPRISDAVAVWASDDVDAEVASAREE